MQAPSLKLTLKNNCNKQIDINSTQMNIKLKYWIELNRVKIFYKKLF